MLKVGAIVLAAGFSSRMGENKLLLKASGECMIVTTVSQLVRANLREVIVVTGHQREEIERALRGYVVRFATCDDFRRGMGRSLAVGINALSKELDGALICLGDMPKVNSDIYNLLIKCRHQKEIIVPTYKNQQGNPVLFSKSMMEKIMEIKGDSGAKKILELNKNKIFNLDINDQGIVKGFNTQKDFNSL